MNREYEGLKLDMGLVPQSIASSNVTGKYFSMAEFRTALAVLTVGNITAGGSAALQIMEAKTEAAGSAQALTSRVATIAANVKVAKMTITLASGTTDDTITIVINGVSKTYTGKGSADIANGEFDASGDDSADAASLLLCMNHATNGLVGVTCTVNAAVITLVADDGYYIDSVAETGSFTTFLTTEAIAYVWLDGLDLTALYTWIACKVTTASNTGICGVTLLRGKSRKAITQKVGASYPA
jgi:hypothetical protein